MNATQRLLVIVGVVVVAAVGFVVLKGTDDSSDGDQPADTTTTLPPATDTTPDAARRPATGATTPARPAAPPVARIVVRGLEPVGGVKDLTFRKGETIRFTVVSDQPEEVHFHGYDVSADVAPGQPARIAVPAKIDGIFEAELEHSGTPIASITVEP